MVTKLNIPAETTATLTLAPSAPTKHPPKFYIASQWSIEAAEGIAMITAVNGSTGDRYEGSISDFNAMLNGTLE